MKSKCRFVGIMFLCIIIVCTLLVMAYERTVEKNTGDNGDGSFTVVTSFYPMYIAALNVIDGADGVKLENLSEPQTGCLHDFQLTPEDMKLLSTADMFIINGGGIETFMSDVAAAYPKLQVVEACENVSLLAEETDHDHDHDAEATEEADHDHDHDHGDENAHAWMSVQRYRTMVSTIADELVDADPDNAEIYYANAKEYDQKLSELESEQQELKSITAGKDIIIFHEAYEYVADDLGMNVCYLLDLDEERSVSAGEVRDVINAIKNDGVSVVLAEELYGKDMGDTVSRETDVDVVYIDPLNRGDYEKDSYIDGMRKNIELVREAFSDL